MAIDTQSIPSRINVSILLTNGVPSVQVTTTNDKCSDTGPTGILPPCPPTSVSTKPPSANAPATSSADTDLDVVDSWGQRYRSWVEYFDKSLPTPVREAIQSRDNPDSRYSAYLVLGYNPDGKINLYSQTTRGDGVRGMRNSIRQSKTAAETLAKLRALYYVATRVHGIPVVYCEGYQAKAVDKANNVYTLIDPVVFESDDFEIGDR